MRRRSSLVLALAVTFGSAEAWGAAGELDPTFGTGGIVTDAIVSGAADVAVLGDGRILAAGSLNSAVPAFVIGRYASSGALDASFGSSGHAVTSIGAAGEAITRIAVQPDGKVVAAGYTYLITFDDPSIAVARYEADGTLDPTFGTGGVAIHNVGPESRAEGLALQPDGKIVLAGALQGSASGGFVARLNADGTLDTAFGSGGSVVESGFGFATQLDAVVVQPDGKIVVAGTDTVIPANRFLLIRYDANGARDTTFGVGGAVLTPVHPGGGWAMDLRPGPGSTLMAIGAAGAIGGPASAIAVARYLASGALDATYGPGANGIGLMAVPSQSTGYRGAVAPDGRVVAAAYRFQAPTYNDLVAARFTPAGTADTAFGGIGWVATHIGNNDFGASIALQSDGKVLVGGTTASPAGMLLVRHRGGLCPPVATAASCKTSTVPEGAKLKIKVKPGNPAKKSLGWKWKKGAGTTLGELGSPFTTTDYTLCGYEASSSPPGALLFEVTAPPGLLWKALGATGFKYKDKTGASDGAIGVKVKTGLAGKASAAVTAKGVNFVAPGLPLSVPVVTQLRLSNGTCFAATFDAGVTRNDAEQFKAKSD